jgi:hypothetical protein
LRRTTAFAASLELLIVMTSSIGLRFLFDQFIGTKSSQYTPAARPLPFGLLAVRRLE